MLRHLQRWALGALIATLVPARAAPWVETEYWEAVVSTLSPEEVDGGVTFSADLWTVTEQISVTQAPAPTPLVQVTSADTIIDLTVVSKLMPAGAGKTIPWEPASSEANYYISLTYSAPETCTSRWTHTTSVLVYVPLGVTPKPIATLTRAWTDTNFNPNFLVAASNIAASSLSTLSSEFAPYWADECTVPAYATATADSYSGSGYGSGDDDWSDCDPIELDFGGSAVGGGYDCGGDQYWTWGLSLTGFICVWVFSFLGFFLICGLLENWFTFRSLCQGHSARRGLPICWAFMFPFLSCFFLLGSSRGFAAKPREEQVLLERRWADLPNGTRFSQWLSWGFRWSYPPFLGAPALQKGVAYIPPQYAPPPMYQYAPPTGGPPPPGFGQQPGTLYPQQEQQRGSWQPQQSMGLPTHSSPYSSPQQPSSPYSSPPQQHASLYGSPPPQQVSPYGPPPPQQLGPDGPPPPRQSPPQSPPIQHESVRPSK